MISLRNVLTQRNIYERIDSLSIFKAYCKNFDQIGKSFKSEFRPDDHPSCRIEMIGDDLLYSDFGEGKYRAIQFVMRKFGLSRPDALRKINFDFNLDLVDLYEPGKTYIPRTKIETIVKAGESIKEKKTTIIKVKYAPFYKEDLDYWSSYGWHYEMLRRASIRPISNFWITMSHINMIDCPFAVTDEKAYTFDYYNHNGIFRRKLYFPEREGKKRFISNVDDTIIQNWDLIPKQGVDCLFITSSKKDTGPFWRLNWPECNAVAPNTEASFLPEEVFYRKIKTRNKRIVLWYDNDATGIENAIKYSKMYGIEAHWNPIGAPKDPSDFVKRYGLREFNWLVQQKLNSNG